MEAWQQISQWLAQMPELAAAPLRADDPRAYAGFCTDVSKLISALETLRSRAMAEGARAEVDSQLGATSMGALVARSHGGDRAEGDREVRRGQDLQGLPIAGPAAGAGELTPKQVTKIAATMKKLPEGLSASTRAKCEEHLVAIAKQGSLRRLSTACDRISAKWLKTEREVDIAEGQILKQREAKARQAAEFSLVSQGDGTAKGWFVIPEVQADLLRSALEAISAPRRDHLNGFEDPICYRHRLGQAFTALCDHLPAEGLPKNTMATKIVVTIDYQALVSGLGAGQLATGTRLSASEVRIMAARSEILPAIMGRDSHLLDLGRSARLFTEHQRTALAVRDKGCTYPGCDRPPAWCEAHHAQRGWAQGGHTDLANGTLLCWHHHRHVETHRWQFRLRPDGTVEWTPPSTSDTHQRPQRNTQHRQPEPAPA